MYPLSHSDHGIRAAEEEGGEALLRKEEPRTQDPHRHASLRQVQEDPWTLIRTADVVDD